MVLTTRSAPPGVLWAESGAAAPALALLGSDERRRQLTEGGRPGKTGDRGRKSD